MEEDEKKISVFKAKLDELFGFDLRSLALMRVSLGLLIIYDLYVKVIDLKLFYTDSGFVPRTLAVKINPEWYISFHLLNGSYSSQLLLFLVAFLFAILLIIGFKTKLSTFISWILLVSMINRNLMITNIGDDILRLFLFWSMFLPLGAVYSVDRALAKNKSNLQLRILDFGSLGFTLQYACIFIFSAILKSKNSDWQSGVGLYYNLNLLYFTSKYGLLLLKLPLNLLKSLTHFVVYFEKFGIFLFFVPVFNLFFRSVGIFLFMGLIIGFGVFLDLENVHLVVLAGLLPFIPSQAWNLLARKFKNINKQELQIYYSYENSLGEKLAKILQEFFSIKECKLSNFQDTSNSSSLFIMDSNENKYFGKDCIFKIFENSKIYSFLLPLIKIVANLKITNFTLNNIQKESYFYSWLNQALSTNEKKIKLGFWGNRLALFFSVYILLINLGTVSKYALPGEYFPLAQILRIDQRWGMFIMTEREKKYGGWFTIEGAKLSGERINILNPGKPLQKAQPEIPSEEYKNRLWRRLLLRLLTPAYNKARPYFCWSICKNYNADKKNKDNKLDKVEISLFRITTNINEKSIEPEKFSVWRHLCLNKDELAKDLEAFINKNYSNEYDIKTIIFDGTNRLTKEMYELSALDFKNALKLIASKIFYDVHNPSGGINNKKFLHYKPLLIRLAKILENTYSYGSNNEGYQKINNYIEKLTSETNNNYEFLLDP